MTIVDELLLNYLKDMFGFVEKVDDDTNVEQFFVYE